MQGSVSELNKKVMIFFYLVLVPASIHSAPTTRWGKPLEPTDCCCGALSYEYRVDYEEYYAYLSHQ